MKTIISLPAEMVSRLQHR